jgi:hypothetical protein
MRRNRQGVALMGYCHKCEIILPDENLIICYHYDQETVLGVLCDECCQAWLAFESGYDQE